MVLVDTGGVDYGKKESIEADVQAQAELAIEEADLIFFMVNAKEVLTSNDIEAANKLRKAKKEILFIANKIDNNIAEYNLHELFKLGFGEPLTISAYHNIGIEELIEAANKKIHKLGFKKPVWQTESSDTTNICFIGRPNVGKSSLVNALLGKPKVIVSDIPGTTRDATDTEITWNDKKYNLIDTAGLRRRGKIEKGLEKISTFRSLQGIEKSDVVCLILDFEQGIRKQDQHIAAYALEANKGLMIIVNKTDLMDDRERDESKTIRLLRSRFEFLPWAPAIFTSALKKANVEKILEIADQIQLERFKHIDNANLKGFLKETVYKNEPSRVSNMLAKFYGLEQVGVNPPTFAFRMNEPKAVHFSYRRYLENEIRKRWPFTGTAIRMVFKKNQHINKDAKRS